MPKTKRRLAGNTSTRSAPRFTPLPNPVSLSTATTNNKKYRGGFSTSICHLFHDPRHHGKDCCALSCCGVLPADRARYLLLNEASPWRYRIGVCSIPVVLLLIHIAMARRLQRVVTEDHCMTVFDADGDNELDLSIFYQKDSNRLMTDYVGELMVSAFLVFVAAIACLCIFCCSVNGRFLFRKQLIQRRYGLVDNEEADATGSGRQLVEGGLSGTELLNYNDLRQATNCCGCYSAPDDITIYDDLSLAEEEEGDGDEGIDEGTIPEQDLCVCIWKFLSSMFFFPCCQCWCMCCGMCAIGQEERELDVILEESGDDNRGQFNDYITFQSFSEYVPMINHLRQSRDGSIKSNYQAMSELSKRIVRYFAAFLLGAVLLAFTNIYKNWLYLLAFFAVIFQGLLLTYIFYRTCRFDISLDSVVKCMASGAILGSSNAILVETILMIPYGVLNLAGVLAAGESLWFDVFSSAFNAFFIAAFVEELVKFFGFAMVNAAETFSPEQHQKMLAYFSNGSGEEVAESVQSLKSRGKAITMGMVAVAIGFACVENMEYALMYSSDAKTELTVLLLRFLTPCHPLAAAIQSIGVCRRELEGDTTRRLGRTILPAVLVHGFFDFFLIVLEKIALRDYESVYNAWLEVCIRYDVVDTTVWHLLEIGGKMKMATIVLYGLSFGSLLLGLVYYIIQSRRQTVRLEAMDASYEVEVVQTEDPLSLT